MCMHGKIFILDASKNFRSTIYKSIKHTPYVYILEVNVGYNSYRSYIINLLLLAFLLFCAASLHAC